MKNQYDTKLSGKYTDLVRTDPAKMFVQYPEALRLLGNIRRNNVLDIGCGSGAFDILLQKHRSGPVGEVRLKFESRFAKFLNKDYMIDAPMQDIMGRNINFDSEGRPNAIIASKMNADDDLPADDDSAF